MGFIGKSLLGGCLLTWAIMFLMKLLGPPATLADLPFVIAAALSISMFVALQNHEIE